MSAKDPWLFRHWAGAYVVRETWRQSRKTGVPFRKGLPIVYDEFKRRRLIK